MAQFKFIGNIKKMKDSDTFKSLEVRTFGGGFANKTLKFQGINGNNKHFLQVKAGYYAQPDGSVDASKAKIYTFKAPAEGETKMTALTVAYEDRNNSDIVKSVPYARKFTINLNNPGENEENKKKEFLFEGDFIEVINAILNKPEYADRRFVVSGNVEISYNPAKDVYYRTFAVRHLALAGDTESDKMEVTGTFTFCEDSWDDEAYADNGRVRFTCWSREYDGRYKNDSCGGVYYCPIESVLIPSTLGADGLAQKIFDVYKSRIGKVADGARYGTASITFEVVDGAEASEVGYDDLPEDVKQDIDLGLVTIEDALKQQGGRAYGPRVQEYRIKLVRNAKSDETIEDWLVLGKPTHDATAEVQAAPKAATTSNNDDLFADFDI